MKKVNQEDSQRLSRAQDSLEGLSVGDGFGESLFYVNSPMDTNAAIVGGIVAVGVGINGIPAEWLLQREPI